MVDVTYGAQGITLDGQLIPWETVDAERDKIRFADSVLVKISFQYGRVSFIEDQEIYDRAKWAEIKENLRGLTAWYSDFAGKHSEVGLTFWEGVDLKEITNLDAISEFHRAHGMYQHDLGIVESAIEQAMENGDLDEEGNRVAEEEE